MHTLAQLQGCPDYGGRPQRHNVIFKAQQQSCSRLGCVETSAMEQVGQKIFNQTLLDEAVSYEFLYAGRDYSPLALWNDWSKGSRLLFLGISATVGTVLNIYFITSFFIQHGLMHIGNAYHASSGLSDLMVSLLLMAVAMGALFNDSVDTLPVCKMMEVIGAVSVYSYNMFYGMIAADCFYRICRTSAEYEVFISMRSGPMSLVIFGLGFAIAFVGVMFRLDYDYCMRKYEGNLTFRSLMIIFNYILLPIAVLVTLGYVKRTQLRRARNNTPHRRSYVFQRDYARVSSSLMAYIIFVICWIPHIVIVTFFPNSGDALYYNSIWFALYRSVFIGFVYPLQNEFFRQAYIRLFCYIFCKVPLTQSTGPRRVRRPANVQHFVVVENIAHRNSNGHAITIQETVDL